jgi:hypothetical protein
MSLSRRILSIFRRRAIPQTNISTQEHYVVRRKLNFDNGEYEIARSEKKYSENFLFDYKIKIFFFGTTTIIQLSNFMIFGAFFPFSQGFNIIMTVLSPIYGFFLLYFLNIKRNVIKKISFLEKGNKVKFELEMSFKKLIVNTTDLSLLDENNFSNIYSLHRAPFLFNYNPVMIKERVYLIDESTEIYDRELFCLIFKGKNIVFEEAEGDDIDRSKFIQLNTKDNTNYYGF